MGLTQQQLADLLNYSEKSISKWESGRGLPGIEVLVKISEILNMDIGSMLECESRTRFYLGIDGGATKTAFALADENGRVIKIVKKGSCNPFDVGMKEAQDVLDSGIREICQGIPFGSVSVFAGISGGASGGNKNIFCEFFKKYGFFRYQNDSDTENAIATGLGTGDGIAVIMGTGSVIISVKNGVRRKIGGFGYLFDDSLCGYDLGKSAIVAALRSGEGSGEKTLLEASVTKLAGGNPQQKLSDFYSGGKTYIASFASLVFDAYSKGDAAAKKILEKRTEFLSEQIACALTDFDKTDKVKIACVGGISRFGDTLAPLILKHLNEYKNVKLVFSEKKPVDGALFLAGAPIK